MAPISWWLAHHVEEAREHLNFSDWGRLSSEKRSELREEIWEEVEEDEMPLPSYRLVHGEARLSPDQFSVIKAWSESGGENHLPVAGAEARRRPAGGHRERDVVYGTVGDERLLMDVHYPGRPNGIGVVFVGGSAWRGSAALGGIPLKQAPRQVRAYVEPLVGAGYTVFSLNHRPAPEFPYPAAVEDTQRAVRFIRHRAEHYSVDGSKLGAVGFSSGGNLVALLAVMDGDGDSGSGDPVDRESSKVQCAIGLAAPADLSRLRRSWVGPYLGRRAEASAKSPGPWRKPALASPVTYVSADDPPILLIHGDLDRTVPSAQSDLFARRLREAGVEVKLVQLPREGHAIAPDAGDPPVSQMILDWLAGHLINT